MTVVIPLSCQTRLSCSVANYTVDPKGEATSSDCSRSHVYISAIYVYSAVYHSVSSIITAARSSVGFSRISPSQRMLPRCCRFLPRDAMYKRGLCCHALSVCLSVTFRSCAKTNKDIFEIFSPSGSDTILVFPYRRGCRYSDGNPLTGASNARGYDKMSTFFTNISLYLRTVIFRWTHAARRFVSIEFPFHPYNI